MKISAAQYLRMSTEHQRYSVENQAASIASYAAEHGFEVTKTYQDAARTGLVLKHRDGLRQLLSDVVQGPPPFRAVLVYDVSRWGRFQDADESAHYEYLCRAAGVQVHYCAEPFDNDQSLANTLLKALKRSMAGEYSRELGVKVFDGTVRNVKRGYKSGSAAGYGLARLLVDSNDFPKQVLRAGERKSLQTEHVVLIPGDLAEIECVRRIFRMFVEERLSIPKIVDTLNKEKVPYIRSSQWKDHAVRKILKHPRYCGTLVYGMTSKRLQGRTTRIPRADWTVVEKAFPPIVSQDLFLRAQQRISGFARHQTSEELLEALRAAFLRYGRLSENLIECLPNLPCPSTYCKRFGSLAKAYELIGYSNYKTVKEIQGRKWMMQVRSSIVAALLKSLPGSRLLPKHRCEPQRPRLRLADHRILSILICRVVRILNSGELRWRVQPFPRGSRSWTLLVRMNELNELPLDFHLLKGLDSRKSFRLGNTHCWLKIAKPIEHLADIPKIMRLLT
jgi:DNA invertase Pin-like site-specific DNA recombinase